ncbi:MAG: hypothetical protein HC902_01675 [Calothrix sp. SM1_5_4]|nr:hypothetical protein [Calothrix sp. SM1_5_4]
MIADHLARAGVKKFILIDGAKLDAPDLKRQWTFNTGGIGQAKVELLARHLAGLGAEECRIFQRMLFSDADLDGLVETSLDLIVCAADKPRFVIEKLVLSLAERIDAPVLFGSVGLCEDHVGEVLVGSAARAAERARLVREEGCGIDAKVGRGSLCFTNTMTATRIGYKAYRFLLGMRVTQD